MFPVCGVLAKSRQCTWPFLDASPFAALLHFLARHASQLDMIPIRLVLSWLQHLQDAAVYTRCRHCCIRSCQSAHNKQTSVHPPAFPCYADIAEDAEADADVEAATGSAIEPNVEAGAHRGVEGDEVGVEGCDDLQGQSHTVQQVCSFLVSLLSFERYLYSMYKQLCR